MKKPANTASFKTHIKKKSPEKKHERQKMKKFNNFFRCKKIRKTSFSKKSKILWCSARNKNFKNENSLLLLIQLQTNESFITDYKCRKAKKPKIGNKKRNQQTNFSSLRKITTFFSSFKIFKKKSRSQLFSNIPPQFFDFWIIIPSHSIRIMTTLPSNQFSLLDFLLL